MRQPPALAPTLPRFGPDDRHPRAVVGLSGSPASWRALAYGYGWAGRTSGTVFVVHVSSTTWQDCGDGYAYAARVQARHDRAVQLERDARRYLGDALAWSFCHVSYGTARHAVDHTARQVHADVLILGQPRHRASLRWSHPHATGHETVIIAVP